MKFDIYFSSLKLKKLQSTFNGIDFLSKGSFFWTARWKIIFMWLELVSPVKPKFKANIEPFFTLGDSFDCFDNSANLELFKQKAELSPFQNSKFEIGRSRDWRL